MSPVQSFLSERGRSNIRGQTLQRQAETGRKATKVSPLLRLVKAPSKHQVQPMLIGWGSGRRAPSVGLGKFRGLGKGLGQRGPQSPTRYSVWYVRRSPEAPRKIRGLPNIGVPSWGFFVAGHIEGTPIWGDTHTCVMSSHVLQGRAAVLQ